MKLIKPIIITLCLLMLFACSKTEPPKEPETEKQILGLISIGMNIDEARNELINKGFKVGEKYYPTSDKSYYQMNIPLVSEIPVSETVRYVSNKSPGNKKVYIVVIADKDGNITKVE